MNVFECGGYEVKYCKHNGCYPGYIAFEEYATKAEALKGINQLDGIWLKITEFPGNRLPGKRIDIADLEEPEKE